MPPTKNQSTEELDQLVSEFKQAQTAQAQPTPEKPRLPSLPTASKKWIPLVLALAGVIILVVGGMQLIYAIHGKRLLARLQLNKNRRAELNRLANLAPFSRGPGANATLVSPEEEERLLEKCSTDPKFCHLTGATFEREKAFTDALRFYDQSCQYNYGPACASLAGLYLRGTTVAQSVQKALELYVKSCESSSAEGCLTLGRFYLNGTFVATSTPNALLSFEKACTLSSGEACYELARIHLGTSGGAVNRRLATTYFQFGCRLKYQPACNAL